MKILVIEDELKLAGYLHKGLTEEGFVVDVAHDGIDGLHLATSDDYDLILLDGMLPGIDGLEVVRRLRKDRPALAAFLVTGYADADTVTLASAGFEHNLYNYGGTPPVPLSDMNRMGHFWIGAAWFLAYWMAFATILTMLAYGLWRRGAFGPGSPDQVFSDRKSVV